MFSFANLFVTIDDGLMLVELLQGYFFKWHSKNHKIQQLVTDQFSLKLKSLLVWTHVYLLVRMVSASQAENKSNICNNQK